MEGIQLLGVPSMNLNPGSARCAQNHGTSGIETKRQASEKSFAIQRMASFCSWGINMSKRAPTRGVNKMIERIWLCIFVHYAGEGARATLSLIATRNRRQIQPVPSPLQGHTIAPSPIAATAWGKTPFVTQLRGR